MAADGRLLYPGAHYGSGTYSDRSPRLLNPTKGTFTGITGAAGVLDLKHRNMAMSAVVGSADQGLVWVAGGGFPRVASAYLVGMDDMKPTATAGPTLPAAKSYVPVSDLPDLTALETGDGTAIKTPVYEASILDPSTRTLTPAAPPTIGRTYHSSSLTLADGRVATCGGDPGGYQNFKLKVEVYSPPYLFKGDRPTIGSAPTELTYGGTYPIVTTAGDQPIAYASLLRPGSATHSMDSSQRALKLDVTTTADGTLITMPTNPNVAIPGWYMLSVVDAAGRPSPAT